MAEEQKEEKPAAADDGVPEPKSKKKLMMIIAGAVVLAAAIGGGAFFMLSGDDNPATMAAESPITPMTDAAGGEQGKDKGAGGAKADDGEHVDKPTGTAAAGEGGEDGKAPVSEEDFDFGDSFKLETFNLNLGNPLENRYIRLDVALEYKGGEGQKKELVKRTPQIRDVVVTVVSRKTREFLLSPDGKSQLRKELLTRINRYMSRPIESVYLTDILIE